MSMLCNVSDSSSVVSQVFTANQQNYGHISSGTDDSDDDETDAGGDKSTADRKKAAKKKVKDGQMTAEVASLVPSQQGPGPPTMMSSEFQYIQKMPLKQVKKLKRTFPLGV